MQKAELEPKLTEKIDEMGEASHDDMPQEPPDGCGTGRRQAEGLLEEIAAQIPEAAEKMAEKEGISLLEACLRFYREEEAQVKRGKEKEALAASRSAGSLWDAPACPAVESDAFAGAFRTALY